MRTRAGSARTETGGPVQRRWVPIASVVLAGVVLLGCRVQDGREVPFEVVADEAEPPIDRVHVGSPRSRPAALRGAEVAVAGLAWHSRRRGRAESELVPQWLDVPSGFAGWTRLIAIHHEP